MTKVVLKHTGKQDIEVGDYILLEDSFELRQIMEIGKKYIVCDPEEGTVYNPSYNTIDELLDGYEIHRIIKSDDMELREI